MPASKGPQLAGMRSAQVIRLVSAGTAVGLALWAPALSASARVPSSSGVTHEPLSPVPAPLEQDLALGASTGDRAVVVIEGGGSAHPFTTPWDACDGGRDVYVNELSNAGLPVFTAPGYGNYFSSTSDRSGCPLQPPLEVQWNTSGYPTQAGQAVLGFLGYLNATYGYRTFDLVGYSYGGVIARATIAALKQAPPLGSMAPGSMAPSFSYAQSAVGAGVAIPSLVTLNSPHLGGPAYDIALNPTRFYKPVAKAWGTQFADSAVFLADFERTRGAGSIHVLSTRSHAKEDAASWDATQPGVLDGVQVTLIAGDYCGRLCGDDRTAATPRQRLELRTDGTVPVYSQLMLPCSSPCPAPPGLVYLPPGMVPNNVMRKTFPTVHSLGRVAWFHLAQDRSVTNNPEAIAYLVDTVAGTWRTAGTPMLTPTA